MILTCCPYCKGPLMIEYDYSCGYGFLSNKCNSCNEVMWIEWTTVGGHTLSHEEFIKRKDVDQEEADKIKQQVKNYIDG